MLILAPMQGLTELLFRRVYEQCFPGVFSLAVSPFLSLTHGDLSGAWEKIDDVLPEPNRGSIPVIPQILGKEPEEFVALANRLYEIGYKEVNWNIGCPVRRVAAKHRGSGILPYPNEIRDILDHVIPRLRGTLSVKMRLGLRSSEEIFDVIPVLNDFPLASVTIHPRTGKQQYGGLVDLDTFARALPLIRHHVIYNGDIHSLADYHRIHARFPQIEDFMLGRGVLYNPQLPLQIRHTPSPLRGTPPNLGGERLPQSEAVSEACCISSCSPKLGEPKVGDRQWSQLSALLTEECVPNSQFSILNSQFIMALVDAIYALPVSDEAHMRKTKEYWCLLWHSLPITQQQATAVLHAPDAAQTRSTLEKIISSI